METYKCSYSSWNKEQGNGGATSVSWLNMFFSVRTSAQRKCNNNSLSNLIENFREIGIVHYADRPEMSSKVAKFVDVTQDRI